MPSTTESSINLTYFNTLPRQSSLRLPANSVLPDYASKNYELHVLWVSRADVEEEGDHAVRDFQESNPVGFQNREIDSALVLS
ncbi:hypothetical protein H4582DRAFT_2067922 [Lactarius indigo]|nr:hypothetical protein H4582DRAFT_2067922 [Lactarius indigo]